MSNWQIQRQNMNEKELVHFVLYIFQYWYDTSPIALLRENLI